MKKRFGLILVFAGIFAVFGWFVLCQQLQVSKESFGIYLLENYELVISDEDIVWYNQTSHEVKLAKGGVEKIEALHVSLYGSPFVVKVNGEEIYNGSFVTPISSIPIPPSEVVIETLVQDNIIKIQRGYPASQFGDQDSRNNPKIFGHFQRIGKLAQ